MYLDPSSPYANYLISIMLIMIVIKRFLKIFYKMILVEIDEVFLLEKKLFKFY